MNLQTTQELKAEREKRLKLMTPAKRETIERAARELQASGISGRAVKAGDKVEDFTLPDAGGKPWRLEEQLQQGPVVISFYRGGWCPYCNIELRGLQRALPEIRAAGASLLAISPELPDNSLSTKQKNDLEFAVLSDVGNVVAKRFGIVYALPEDLLAAYAASNHALSEVNGEQGAAELPLPATFVVGSGEVVALAFVDEDYIKRLDPDIIVETLRGLRA